MKHSSNGPDLSFSISPDTVHVSANPSQSSYTNLTVQVTNTGADTLNVRGVTITLPLTLAAVSGLKSIDPSALPANLWNFHPSPFTDGEFDVSPASGSTVTMKSGDTWTFMLKEVTLVNTITQKLANVVTAVYFADNTNISQNLPVKLDLATAGITFTANLPDITPGQMTTLSWQGTSIDYCILEPGDGTKLLAQGTENVTPQESTTYTLFAYGDGVILSAQFNITVENPQIISFSAAEGEERVDLNGYVTLKWQCNEFTDSIEIVANTSVPIPPITNPHNGSALFGPMVAPTIFTLRAFAKNKTIFSTEAAAVGIHDVTAALTATPSTGLWVQDEITVSWNITNATEVTFSPEIPEGPSLQKLSGSAVYNPPAGVTSLPLKLTAKGFVNDLKKSVTNQPPIVLEFQSVAITSLSITPAAIRNNNTPNEATLAWNTQAQHVSIDKIGDVDPIGSKLLSAPANGAIYTLSAGTNQHPGMVSKQVQVINAHGPFTCNRFYTVNNPHQDYSAFCVPGLESASPYINQPCTIMVTGITIEGAPITHPISAYVVPTPYGVLGFRYGDMGEMNWADPHNPTGTIIVT